MKRILYMHNVVCGCVWVVARRWSSRVADPTSMTVAVGEAATIMQLIFC